MITPDDILLHMLQTGQITLTEYLKIQELPSEIIKQAMMKLVMMTRTLSTFISLM